MYAALLLPSPASKPCTLYIYVRLPALDPVRLPELCSHRGCVHHIATQQLDHSAVTVAGPKRTRTPLEEPYGGFLKYIRVYIFSAHVRVRPSGNLRWSYTQCSVLQEYYSRLSLTFWRHGGLIDGHACDTDF